MDLQTDSPYISIICEYVPRRTKHCRKIDLISTLKESVFILIRYLKSIIKIATIILKPKIVQTVWIELPILFKTLRGLLASPGRKGKPGNRSLESVTGDS